MINTWSKLKKTYLISKNLVNTEKNLSNTELYPQKTQSWFDVNGVIFCSFAVFTHIQKNISLEDIPNNENLDKNAFEAFAKTNLNNPEFKNKFVAFVNGKFQDVGDKKNELIKKMYNKFGNVHMYVHKMTDQKKIILIDTPEFISH